MSKTAPTIFDPYHRWLGIPQSEQPPHHYRLLGIGLFEDDPEVIQSAADRQMAHVRTFQMGRFAADSQRLLNELSAATLCLLDDAKKRDYDLRLRRRLENKGELQPVARKLPYGGSPPLAQPLMAASLENAPNQIAIRKHGMAIEAPALIGKRRLPEVVAAPPPAPAAPPPVAGHLIAGEQNGPQLPSLATAVHPAPSSAPSFARPIAVSRRKSSAALAVFLGVTALAMFAALLFLLLN